MMMPMLGLALFALTSFSHGPAHPVSLLQSAKTDITLDQVMEGVGDEVDEEPQAWLPNNKSYAALENAETGGQEIDGIDARTGERSVLVSASMLMRPGIKQRLNVEHFTLSADAKKALIFTNSSRVWRQNTKGDYWALDIATGKLRKIGGEAKASSLMFAKFSPDGLRVGYVYDHDIYSQDLGSGAVTRLTHGGSETLINGTFDWVYEEELDLRDGWRWSPDGKSIAYWQLDTHEEPIFTLINDTDTLYPTLKRFPYPKAGQTNATARIGVVSIQSHETKWLWRPADSASGYLSRMQWAPNGHELLIQSLSRPQNRLQYVAADVVTGKDRIVATDTDPQWVDAWGPDDTDKEGVRWIDGGKAFLILSERDGWRHLYSVNLLSGETTLITKGEFDVDQVVGFNKALHAVYLIASPENATQRYLFATTVSGPNKPVRITPADPARYEGSNSYSISPDGALALHRHSTLQSPPNSEVVTLPDHRTMRTVDDGQRGRRVLDGYNLGQTHFVKFNTADGQPMDGYEMLPPHFDATKKYPLFFEVYGEPADLTAQDSFSSESFLFHEFLAERGYIVASVDNRGTPTLKGRAWRKSVYQKIGILASADQAAAVRQLLQRPYVDAARVGVWGWSGGGSMTLNLLFRYPDLYALGMAVAPVPDVSLYDSIYQERYLGMPQTSPSVYRQCSPITFAGQLKGALLIVHGSGDDNVHYQGTERLVNALVAADKPFQLMIYPNRSHGIFEGEGTSHHLFELLVQFLTTHMPPGPR